MKFLAWWYNTLNPEFRVLLFLLIIPFILALISLGLFQLYSIAYFFLLPLIYYVCLMVFAFVRLVLGRIADYKKHLEEEKELIIQKLKYPHRRGY